jgi:hypothetical protein
VKYAPIPVPESALQAFKDAWLPLAAKLRQGNATPVEHDRVLAGRLADALSGGVAAMVPIPDEVWNESGRVPYDPERGDLFARDCALETLEADPGHDVARWTVIAWELCVGDNDFAATLLEPLVERDVSNVCWLVAAARWIYDLSGVETSEALRASLMRLVGRVDNFSKRLDELQQSADPHANQMVQVAEAVLSGAAMSEIGATVRRER